MSRKFGMDKLLWGHEADSYRSGGKTAEGLDPEPATATGRSRCRSCNQMIAKGEPALAIYHDFIGDGSWTSVMCHIHADNCINIIDEANKAELRTPNPLHNYFWRRVDTVANLTPDDCETASFMVTEHDAGLYPELLPRVGHVITLTDAGQSELWFGDVLWSVA